MTEKNPPAFDSVAPYYEHLMSSVPYRFWLKHIERYWESIEAIPERVLDLATGTGTMARILAAQGKTVVGVDLSEQMLQIARRRAADEGLDVAWYRQDMADLDLPEAPFDSAICLFDSLNYILEEDRIREALRRIARHLRSGGAFVFDVNTDFAFDIGMFNQSCSRRSEPLHYRWRSRYDESTRICTVRMTFTYRYGDGRPDETFHEVHTQRAYGKDDLTAWLEDAGFGSIRITDSYSDEEPYAESDRLVFRARKI